jgi:hypothetical protein
MKVELKNLKLAEFSSQETACFQATLYINGKKAAIVSNDGQGGCNRYDFNDRQLQCQFHAYCKTLPPLPPDPSLGITSSMEMNADLLVESLMNEFLIHKKLTRVCKKETLFRLEGDPEGAYRSVQAPFSQKVKSFLSQKYGASVIEIANERIGQVAL